MELGLQDKVALISGSSRGIGYAVATSMLEHGARVIINGRNKEQLDTAYDALVAAHGSDNVFSFLGDLTKEDDINRCVQFIQQQCSGLDILVSNIGSGKSQPGAEVALEEWKRMFDVNFFGSVSLIQAMISMMKEKAQGSIVCISSIAGLETIGAPLPYEAAKAALISYVQALAKQLAPNIRVNSVAPGNIFFAGGRWEELVNQDSSGVQNMLDSKVPMKRFGTPEEIASVVSFLSSQQASFVTGATWVADGGQTISR